MTEAMVVGSARGQWEDGVEVGANLKGLNVKLPHTLAKGLHPA